MSNRVNSPPVVRIDARNPYKPGTQEHRFANQLISVIRQQNLILEQLWRRTGAGEDLVSNTATREHYGWDTTALFDQEILPAMQVSAEEKTDILINIDSDPVDWSFVSVASNYTAVSFDFIRASKGCQVKFPEYPGIDDKIKIRNEDGTVIKLNPNGRKINGEISGKIKRKLTCVGFIYDGDEWVAA